MAKYSEKIIDPKAIEKAVIQNYEFTGREVDLTRNIVNNISEISENCGWGEIEEAKTEYTIFRKGRIDLMIWHKDGTGTIIEVKRSRTNRLDILAAISQCLYYRLKAKQLFGNFPRAVIAANRIDIDVYEVIRAYKLPIQLLMIDYDRCIYLQ